MRRVDKLTTFICRLSWNLGALTSWNPQGLPRDCFTSYYTNLSFFCEMLCSQSRVDEVFSTDGIYLLKEFGRQSEISRSCTSNKVETPTQTHRIDSCNWNVKVSFHVLQKQSLARPHSVTLHARSNFLTTYAWPIRKRSLLYKTIHTPAKFHNISLFSIAQNYFFFYHRRTFL